MLRIKNLKPLDLIAGLCIALALMRFFNPLAGFLVDDQTIYLLALGTAIYLLPSIKFSLPSKLGQITFEPVGKLSEPDKSLNEDTDLKVPKQSKKDNIKPLLLETEYFASPVSRFFYEYQSCMQKLRFIADTFFNKDKKQVFYKAVDSLVLQKLLNAGYLTTFGYSDMLETTRLHQHLSAMGAADDAIINSYADYLASFNNFLQKDIEQAFN